MHLFGIPYSKTGIRTPGSPEMNLALLPQAPVWVLDDPHSGAAGQASAIAGRLGLPFRRLTGAPNQAHRPGGPGPGLVLSAGMGSGLTALLLRSRHGCRVVHCATGRISGEKLSGWLPFDLTIVPQLYAPSETREGVQPEIQGGAAAYAAASAFGAPGPGATGPGTTGPSRMGPSRMGLSRTIPVLGAPNVVSPGMLARARDLWAERLSHLPQPRVVLLFGGSDQQAALGLGRQVAALVRERGGCVLASVLPSGGPAGDALAAGLSASLHLIYRADEPGEDPTLGFLGHADAVVVAGVGALTLSEACAASAPIFSAAVGHERREARRLLERLHQAGQVRPLGADLSPWPRQPLDEAGRVAQEIRNRFGSPARRMQD